MQSGKAKTGHWVLEFDREQPRRVEPLMGYTSSSDMRQQVHLRFDSKEAAIAYAEKNGVAYRIDEAQKSSHIRKAYSDNFRYDRRTPWTH